MHFFSKKAVKEWTLTAFEAFSQSASGPLMIPQGKQPRYCIAIAAYASFGKGPTAGTYYGRWVIPFGKQFDKASAILLAHCFAQVLLPQGFGVDIYQMHGSNSVLISHLGPDDPEVLLT